jgi:secondary thiamine-phosphate synthase enzyme
MKIIQVSMGAHGAMKNITDDVRSVVSESGKDEGAVLVFTRGSTGAVTTIEYEPGLQQDFPRIMEKIAPRDEYYAHHETWHDDNGSSHIKASIITPSLIVPFKNKRLLLGTWQQIVVINFDTSPRKRDVIIAVL